MTCSLGSNMALGGSILVLCVVSLAGASQATSTTTPGDSGVSAFDVCPTGRIFNASSEQCLPCRPAPQPDLTLANPYNNFTSSSDGCYPGSRCLAGDDPGGNDTALCQCEAPLVITTNREKGACGNCDPEKGINCPSPEECFPTVSHGSVCVVPCNATSDCETTDPNMECELPHWMASAREARPVCICKDGFLFARGFGCVLPQEPLAPLQCYSCSGAECDSPPYDVITCERGQVCFVRTGVAQFVPGSYGQWDYAYFNRTLAEVTRGCMARDEALETHQEELRARNASLWQNCHIVSPDGGDIDYTAQTGTHGRHGELHCLSTCGARLCNWQVIDPIVRATQPEVLPKETVIYLSLLFCGMILVIILFMYYLYVRKQRDEDQHSLLSSDDSSYGSQGKEALTINASSRIDTGIRKKPTTSINLG